VGKMPQGDGDGDEEWEVETHTAARLKKAARKAMGENEEECELITTESFLKKYF